MVTKAAVSNAGLLLLLVVCVGLTVVTCFHYPGNVLTYVVFSICVNALLFLGLRRDSLFFDFFIGALFWLGYWFKFSVRMTFLEGKFHVSVGLFDYSAADYDHSLTVVSCGVAALLLVRLLRARYVFTYLRNPPARPLAGLSEFYERRKKPLWIAFCALTLAIAVSNAYLGIYQRGLAPGTVLPFGLTGVYTWLLTFGAASISALMLDFEIKRHRAIPYMLLALVLLETFSSNVSMLSRGMILNTGALLSGIYVAFRICGINLRPRATALMVLTVIALFAASVLLVNSLRQFELYAGREDAAQSEPNGEGNANINVGRLAHDSNQLFIDRWVGIEGVMAVSSYPQLGWRLLKEAWGERYSNFGASMYDLKIAGNVSKEYSDWMVKNRKHFITLPGVIAFFYYSGSFVVLFFAMALVGSIGAGIEYAVYRVTGNLILCALIAFVVAYRFAQFGYVPARSYLLFGAVGLNILVIYLADRLLRMRHGRSDGTAQ